MKWIPTKQEIRTIISLYKKGHSLIDIGKQLHHRSTAIREVIITHSNIKIKQWWEVIQSKNDEITLTQRQYEILVGSMVFWYSFKHHFSLSISIFV